MKLTQVTITGADDGTNVSALKDLSLEFPFVEWGILFSMSKQGSARFPTEDWLESLKLATGVNLSAHLCGQWVVTLTNPDGSFTFRDYLGGIYKIFQRMQLNMTDDRFMTLDFGMLSKRILDVPEVILQTKRKFLRHEWLRLLNAEHQQPAFSLLYDVSGGKGVTPKGWTKPMDGIHCGLAGGLNPDNLAKQLESMNSLIGEDQNPIWIDMESGIRTDDKFDLTKVRQCLEIAKPYVTQE